MIATVIPGFRLKSPPSTFLKQDQKTGAFVIIFGWSNLKSVSGSGEFECPVCKVSTPYNQVRTRRWFSLFFVPIFPLSHAEDAIECRQCRTSIRTNALVNAPSLAPSSGGISQIAIIGMLLGIISLLMSCLFFVATPMSLFAVILSHSGLRSIKKSQPPLEGSWQAITGLVTGYMALCLSIAIGTIFIMAPKWFPRDRGIAVGSLIAEDQDDDDGEFRISDGGSETLKVAEFEIAAKRDKPAGRGNSPKAIAMAQEYSEKLKELSDLLFTSGKKSLIQLSDGEYLTYCELNRDSCAFIVHVPSYRKFTNDAKKALVEIAWATAQVTTAGKLQPNTRLGVGLRGVIMYGEILVGTSVESSESTMTPYRSGTKEDLVTFFQGSETSQFAKSEISGSANQDPFAANAASPVNSQDAKLESDFFGDVENQQSSSKLGISIASSEKSERDSKQSAIKDTPSDAVSGTYHNSRMADKSRTRAASEEPPFENKIPIRILKVIENDSWGFTSLALSPNGKWLAGGKMDQSLVIVNAQTWAIAHHEEKIGDLGQVSTLAFNSSSDRIIAGGGSGQTKIWEISDFGQLQNVNGLFRFENEVRIMEVSQKHPFFLGASAKGTIAWQSFADSRSQPRILQEFDKNIRAIWIKHRGASDRWI